MTKGYSSGLDPKTRAHLFWQVLAIRGIFRHICEFTRKTPVCKSPICIWLLVFAVAGGGGEGGGGADPNHEFER